MSHNNTHWSCPIIYLDYLNQQQVIIFIINAININTISIVLGLS